MTVSFGTLKRPRRYALAKRISSSVTQDGLYGVWRATQEAEPGAALPANFPHRTKLADVGYETVEDIDGADADELSNNVGLRSDEAAAVLTALQPLI